MVVIVVEEEEEIIVVIICTDTTRMPRWGPFTTTFRGHCARFPKRKTFSYEAATQLKKDRKHTPVEWLPHSYMLVSCCKQGGYYLS